jgi:hypothetical protein
MRKDPDAPLRQEDDKAIVALIKLLVSPLLSVTQPMVPVNQSCFTLPKKSVAISSQRTGRNNITERSSAVRSDTKLLT